MKKKSARVTRSVERPVGRCFVAASCYPNGMPRVTLEINGVEQLAMTPFKRNGQYHFRFKKTPGTPDFYGQAANSDYTSTGRITKSPNNGA